MLAARLLLPLWGGEKRAEWYLLQKEGEESCRCCPELPGCNVATAASKAGAVMLPPKIRVHFSHSLCLFYPRGSVRSYWEHKWDKHKMKRKCCPKTQRAVEVGQQLEVLHSQELVFKLQR